jgi:hypothetical protein
VDHRAGNPLAIVEATLNPPDPDITEEPYLCQKCQQVIGVTVSQYGRVIGLRLATVTSGYILVRHLSAVCECCNEPVKFSVSDLDLRQVVLELKRIGYF